MLVSVKPGLEMRLSDILDLWMRLPVSVVLNATNSPSVSQTGGGALEATNRAVPEDHSVLSSGIFIGVQTRIGPFGKKKEGLDIYD